MSAVDPRRAGRAVVLTAWAGFFVWLWVTGEVSRYLGPRTYWVVPFGALALGAAVVAQLGTLRRRGAPSSVSAREAAGLVLMLVPILAVVVVPRPGLGALAASKKATSQGAIALGSLAAPAPEPGQEISFVDLHFASQSQEYADKAGIGEGTEVELLGFVTQGRNQPEGTFGLTRFYVSCCAADAVPYSATVVAQEGMPAVDTWLEVAGSLTRRGGRYVVVPDTVTERSEPEDPYLY